MKFGRKVGPQAPVYTKFWMHLGSAITFYAPQDTCLGPAAAACVLQTKVFSRAARVMCRLAADPRGDLGFFGSTQGL